MKSLALIAVSGLALIAAPALAQDSSGQQADEENPIAVVLKRDEQGRATRIRVGEFEYDVCREGRQDGCINPREAGLDFGGVPIDYWPGRPASEIEEGLPPERPAEEPDEG